MNRYLESMKGLEITYDIDEHKESSPTDGASGVDGLYVGELD